MSCATVSASSVKLRLMQQLEAVDQEVVVPAQVDRGPPALPAGARAGVEGGAEQTEDDGFAPHALHDRIRISLRRKARKFSWCRSDLTACKMPKLLVLTCSQRTAGRLLLSPVNGGREAMTSQQELGYEVHQPDGGVPIKRWTRGVAVEDAALRQLENVARMPFIHRWVAAMPDVHWGMGATVGSVIPTVGAIIPAAVGVDIGCGMMAVETSLTGQRPARQPRGGALGDREGRAARAQRQPRRPRQGRLARSPEAGRGGLEGPRGALRPHRRQASGDREVEHAVHLGTLGTGNHFIELCLDEREHGVGDAALGLARGRQPHRLVLHRAWPSGDGAVDDPPAGPEPGVPAGGQRSTSTTTSRRWSGPRTTRGTNRELMMQAVLKALGEEQGDPAVHLGERR
jgi:hypothetical protein